MVNLKGLPPELTKRLLAVATAASVAGLGAYKLGEQDRLDAQAMQIAAVVGSYYESSGKHIGTPYIDRVGKGQPWTVCDGITGPKVIPGTHYTSADCERLGIEARGEALGIAKSNLTHWGQYNPWVRASFIDVAYNVPTALTTYSTLIQRANSGDLVGACLQMPRWVYGTVRGQKQQLPGLVNRRAATRELCEEWGRDGHISAQVLAKETHK